MDTRKLILLTFVFLIPIHLARAADTSTCKPAFDALGTSTSTHWSDFYTVYKKYSVCDDGAIAERFSDSAAQLFAKHWDEIGDFIKLIQHDNDFRYFAIIHMDETDDLNDLIHAVKNAKEHCPVGQKQLCDEIWAQASFPDVAAWLWDDASKKKAKSGGSVGYYPEYDTFVVGDLIGYGHEDIAVAFTLEGIRGGTDWLRYIAVFTKSENPGSQEHDFCCEFQIGGKGIASDEKIEIKNKEIVISRKAYVPGKDAMCCPSKQQILRLKIQDGKLIKDSD